MPIVHAHQPDARITHANREAEQADIDADNDPGQDIALLANTLGKIEERLDDMGEAISRQNTNIRDQVNAIHERFGDLEQQVKERDEVIRVIRNARDAQNRAMNRLDEKVGVQGERFLDGTNAICRDLSSLETKVGNLERAHNNLNETVAKRAAQLEHLSEQLDQVGDALTPDKSPGDDHVEGPAPPYPMQNNQANLNAALDKAWVPLDLSIKPEQVAQYQRNGVAIQIWNPFRKSWEVRRNNGTNGSASQEYRIAPGQEAKLSPVSCEPATWEERKPTMIPNPSLLGDPPRTAAECEAKTNPFAGHSMMGGPVDLERYGVERVGGPIPPCDGVDMGKREGPVIDNPSRAPAYDGRPYKRHVMVNTARDIVTVAGRQVAVDEHIEKMTSTRRELEQARTHIEVLTNDLAGERRESAARLEKMRELRTERDAAQQQVAELQAMGLQLSEALSAAQRTAG